MFSCFVPWGFIFLLHRLKEDYSPSGSVIAVIKTAFTQKRQGISMEHGTD